MQADGGNTLLPIQPGIVGIDYEGDGVGMTRSVKTANGTIVERLESCDDASHEFSYAIINKDAPLPFAGYSAVVKLEALGDNATQVNWVGTFNSRGIDDDKAIGLACSIYKNLIGQARNALT